MEERGKEDQGSLIVGRGLLEVLCSVDEMVDGSDGMGCCYP